MRRYQEGLKLKIINDVVEWLIQSGALVALFSFAWKYGKPWLEAKQKHAKTEQAAASWEVLEKVAATVVDSLVSKSASGAEKYQLAVDRTTDVLNNKGITVDRNAVLSAVQAAYEQSPLTGNSTEAAGNVPAVDPKEVA